MSNFDYEKPLDMALTSWLQIADEDGNLIYEGFAVDNRPCGSGTAFYPDGTRYMEGVWGCKGIIAGREYYPNGQLRFEGAYHHNGGYGPTFPQYGRFFGTDGELLYEGLFRITKSGVGWPTVVEPAEYGKVIQDAAPRIKMLSCEDMRRIAGEQGEC